MTKLRDAIADTIRNAPYEDKDTPGETADAILALPELVAAFKIVEAARAYDAEHGGFLRSLALSEPEVESQVGRLPLHRLIAATAEYDAAVKS